MEIKESLKLNIQQALKSLNVDLALEQKLEAISRLRQALDSVGFLECESVDSLFAWRFLDDVYPIRYQILARWPV